MSEFNKVKEELAQHKLDIKKMTIEFEELNAKIAPDLESSSLFVPTNQVISLINKKIKEYYLDLQQDIKGIKGICEQLKYDNTSATLGKSINDINNYVSDYDQLASAINDATNNVWQELQTEKEKFLQQFSSASGKIPNCVRRIEENYMETYQENFNLGKKYYGNPGDSNYVDYVGICHKTLDNMWKELGNIETYKKDMTTSLEQLKILLDEKGMSKSALAVAATSGINGAVSGTTVTHSASGALAGATVKPSAKWFNTIN